LISDENNCSFAVDFDIDEPTLLIASIISSNDVSCSGADDGTATVSATGGTTPYTYAWPMAAGSQTTATATDLAAGTYEVTVTDMNGCEATAEVTIAEGEELTITPIGDIGPLCAGETVADILLNSSPTDGDVEFSWSGGAAVGLADGNSIGTTAFIPSFEAMGAYGTTATITVEATLNGCVAMPITFDITIDDNEAPTFVNCPTGPVTIGADADCSNGVVWSIPVAEDNCEVVSILVQI
jgi:hypothetical protein